MSHPVRLLIALLASWMTSCAQLPDRDLVTPGYALPKPDSELARRIHHALQAHDAQTGFFPMQSGLDAFVARMVMIEQAQSSLDVQYYLFHDDLIGRLMAAQLLKAADRGVHVRLLLDDWGIAGRDDALLALASHPNIALRLFNPFASRRSRAGEMIGDFGRINRRMHNKSITMDGLVSILGGRNIGNEYFDADPEVAFGDMDVMLAGAVVDDVRHSFDAYWNSDVTYPIELIHHRSPGKHELEHLREKLNAFLVEERDNPYMQRLDDSGMARQLRGGTLPWQWGQASIVADDPRKVLMSEEDQSTHLLPQLKNMVENLRSELIIVSPYFIPGEDGVQFFRDLHRLGIRTIVITNSLASTDVGVVHAGYAKYRKALIEAGVELYEIRAQGKSRMHIASGATRASLHAKTFVFDRQHLFIGSLNLDPRSARINTEIGVIIDHAGTARTLATNLDSGLADAAYRVTLEDGHLVWEADGERISHEPDTSWLRRLGLWLLKPFLIESQL